MSATDKRSAMGSNSKHVRQSHNNKLNSSRVSDSRSKVSADKKAKQTKRPDAPNEVATSPQPLASSINNLSKQANKTPRPVAKKGSKGSGSSCSNYEVNTNEMAGFIAHQLKDSMQNVEQETDLDEESKKLMGDDLEDDGSTKLVSQVSSDTETPKNQSEVESNSHSSTSTKDLASGWEEHSDQSGLYYWHAESGKIQRNKPGSGPIVTSHVGQSNAPIMLFFDDEEINQAAQRTSSDDEDFFESGAALTVDDTSESLFVVYPLGCCEFDETELASVNSTKAIQKCILRLSNKPSKEEVVCWGLDQSQPILMKLCDDTIQFTDLTSRSLLRSQPILSIKTWAVDDDNNFAFVVEDRDQSRAEAATTEAEYYDSMDYSLLNAPSYVCYIFRSMDDDDMSCRVAAKLNHELNRLKELRIVRISKSTRLQQMNVNENEDPTDAEEIDELEVDTEITLHVKYIGSTPVPRPNQIDVLHVAIDKCLAEASKKQAVRSEDPESELRTPLIDCKLHVSPSSVIVENSQTGEIIVECRIRYLTFTGISQRDLRWCGFIMQNATNKTFVAHCFECHPTAVQVFEAIQASCNKMFEKISKHSSQRTVETASIIPTGFKIRDTLAKTFSKIKLNSLASR